MDFEISALFFFNLQAALQKQQEAAATALVTSVSKANSATAGEISSVNGQASAHAGSPEKDLEIDALEEALENGPKGMTDVYWTLWNTINSLSI